MEMNSKRNKVPFPFWEYLRQPIFSSKKQFIFSPQRFALLYRIEFLKKCWALEWDAKGPYQN